MLKIAKWKNNAQSPVMFMVDDLANLWMKNGSHSGLSVGEDWGHFGTDKNSMWSFLNENLYSLFPNIKTTFFLVTDRRSPQILGTEYSYSEAIDKDESFIKFLNMLNDDHKVELAYHGTTHGEATTTNLKQEWDTYENLNQAIETIEHGKELYKKVLGEYPKGGKYCGYSKGMYGDISINKTGFSWWCRDWDAELEKDSSRKDLSFNLEYFSNTIDIPSNIDGSYLSVYRPQFSKKYLITLYKFFKKQSLEKSIHSLYNQKQIISIQEHSSPYRTDGKIQYPNIVSDIKNLQYIFKFLNKLDVWYATGTEVAEYFQAFKNIELKENLEGFVFLFSDDIEIMEGTLVTIILDTKDNNSQIKIKIKDRLYTSYKKNDLVLVDLPVYKNLTYKVVHNE